jgi:uncharacterized protein (DUF302 family)
MPAATDPDTGLETLVSSLGVEQTADRLAALLAEKGIHLFARIDHAAGAQTVGMALRPTVVLLFGNPLAGTPLMQSKQTIGIDLPLKALVWQDEAGRTWLTYNRPDYLARRHGITDRHEAVQAMSAAMAGLARLATAPPPA